MVLAEVENAHSNLVDSCYFGNRSPNIIGGVVRNGADIITVGGGERGWAYDTVIEYNIFEECNGEDEIIASKSNNNIYRYNTFVRCKGFLSLRSGKGALVYGNYFLGQGSWAGGVIMHGEDHRIYNNYFESLQGKPAIMMITGDFEYPDLPDYINTSFPRILGMFIWMT